MTPIKNKAIDEARKEQEALNHRRSQLGIQAKQMNGTAYGMAQNLKDLVKSQTDLGLPDANENEYYNCKTCGTQIQRFYADFLKKYVFPVCRCDTKRLEEEEEKRERLYRKRNMEKAYQHNIMSESLKNASFSTFIIRPGTELICKECKLFAENFNSRNTGLFGFGNPGNGKSHLFASIHHSVDEQGFVSLFIDCSQLFNTADDARKFSSRFSLNEIVNAAIGCDLLTLDELGSGKLSQEEFTDVLFPIINGRQGKVTNYTSNLNIDELAAFFDTDKYGKPLDSKRRLIDRILGSCDFIENEGSSKRQEDAIKRLGG